jgi:hypothetical protein
MTHSILVIFFACHTFVTAWVCVCFDDNMYLWIVFEAFKKLEERIVIFCVV